jgi:hypothetical protein
LASRAECEELLAPDGTVIGHRSSITSGEAKVLAVLLRRDGGQIYAAADNNMPADQPGTSGKAPPLTLDQLEDLVRNDTWVTPAT